MLSFPVIVAVCSVLLCVAGSEARPSPRAPRAACAPASAPPAPPAPASGCCGLEAEASRPLILTPRVGVREYPWSALVEYQRDNSSKLACGGTLVSSRYILTAAHCLAAGALRTGTPVNVILGEYDLKHEGPDCAGDGDCTDGAVSIPIEKFILHPEYDARKKSNDIALIKLARDAPYTEFIRPICLPTTDVTKDAPEKLKFRVAGWAGDLRGDKNDMKGQDLDIKYVDKNSCKLAYQSSRVELTSGHLCAGNSCSGLSGAALVLTRDRSEAVGLVSLGMARGCERGDASPPAVYTHVYTYLDWIKANMV